MREVIFNHKEGVLEINFKLQAQHVTQTFFERKQIAASWLFLIDLLYGVEPESSDASASELASRLKDPVLLLSLQQQLSQLLQQLLHARLGLNYAERRVSQSYSMKQLLLLLN